MKRSSGKENKYFTNARKQMPSDIIDTHGGDMLGLEAAQPGGIGTKLYSNDND